jgi:hypothetical protein
VYKARPGNRARCTSGSRSGVVNALVSGVRKLFRIRAPLTEIPPSRLQTSLHESQAYESSVRHLNNQQVIPGTAGRLLGLYECDQHHTCYEVQNFRYTLQSIAVLSGQAQT